MSASMADIQSATAEIRRGKKKIEEETTWQKYNGVPILQGGHKETTTELSFSALYIIRVPHS